MDDEKNPTAPEQEKPAAPPADGVQPDAPAPAEDPQHPNA